MRPNARRGISGLRDASQHADSFTFRSTEHLCGAYSVRQVHLTICQRLPANMHSPTERVLWLCLVAACCGLGLARNVARDQLQHNDWVLPRMLQQTQAVTGNCTPPRSSADSRKPFCFVPDTISAEARQFLSTAAAGLTGFGAVSFGNTPEEQKAAIAKLRAGFADMVTPISKAAEDMYMQSTRNGTIGGVPVMYAVPKGVNQTSNADTKVLLYIHGGGYISGSCQFQLSVPAVAAATAGLTIICPEYRLAPENPFPAGLNDVLTVYKTMIKDEGYKAGNIVLLGDSAGGGMVPAVAVQLQREGEPLPAALGMFSPYADLRSQGDTTRTLNAVDPLIAGSDDISTGGNARAGTAGMAGMYIGGNASKLDDPLASPVLAEYAALFPNGSLPPTLIQVGLRETLLSDAVRLYHTMRAAAPAPGHVVLSPYEGMWHVFQMFLNIPEAAVASREMGEYFSRALKGYICK